MHDYFRRTVSVIFRFSVMNSDNKKQEGKTDTKLEYFKDVVKAWKKLKQNAKFLKGHGHNHNTSYLIAVYSPEDDRKFLLSSGNDKGTPKPGTFFYWLLRPFSNVTTHQITHIKEWDPVEDALGLGFRPHICIDMCGEVLNVVYVQKSYANWEPTKVTLLVLLGNEPTQDTNSSHIFSDIWPECCFIMIQTNVKLSLYCHKPFAHIYA